MKSSTVAVSLCLIFACSCTLKKEAVHEDSVMLDSLQQYYAPDDRMAVFDMKVEYRAGAAIVRGETDNPKAKDDVLMAIARVSKGSVLDSVKVLPDPQLGDKIFGIVTVSVGNVRTKPGHANEMSTQALMGTVVKLFKKKGGWYFVQLPDNYMGWLEESAMKVTDSEGAEAWKTAKKVIVTSYFAVVRSKADTRSLPVSDAVTGMLLRFISRSGSWVAGELPDGRRGFLEAANVEDFAMWEQSRKLTADNIERTAKLFIGVPYLWGGTSPKGMDCSGFAKTVYRLNGLELSRDADQQARMGDAVDPGRDFANLRKGDLLFFGRKATADKPERITHVGIYLNKGEFIHSPGGAGVRFNSFDPAAANFSESHRKGFVRARRLIGSKQVSEVVRN